MAAGRGARFGAELPKQYLPLLGRPVLRHAAEALLRDGLVDRILPGLRRRRGGARRGGCSTGCLPCRRSPGGDTRQASVRAGLEALAAASPPDAVLVHDAARPVVPPGTVARLLAALETAPGAIPAQRVTDTLKRGEAGRIVATVPREGLFRAQTPQAFRFPVLLAAHRAAVGEATDDAQLLEAAGQAVALVEGSESNVKITFPEDLGRVAASLSAGLLPRIGTGFDVHRIAAGRPMVLCGVRVPCPFGLEGHSDADVGIHALVRRDLRGPGRGRHRAPLPAERDALEGRGQRRVPAPCGRADRGAGRGAGQCRCDPALRAAAHRPAPGGDAGAAGGAAGRPSLRGSA